MFAGYAGWGAGQLEAEVAEEDWILEPALPDDAFTDDPEELWRDVLRRKGGDLRARRPDARGPAGQLSLAKANA